MESNLPMMKFIHMSFYKFKIALVLSVNILLTMHFPANANDAPSPEIPSNMVTLYLTNPDRDVGFHVGDKLKRKIRLEVKKPYKLIPTSLPIVGYERRYKNQVTGIEVTKINYIEKSHQENKTYLIEIEYQVFTTGATAKPAALPSEVLKFEGVKKDDIVQFTIPSFRFRVSPLAVFGAVKIEYDMSTFRAPFLLQTYPEKQKLTIYLSILALSLIFLLYILGSRAWLPLMGKPFSLALRSMKRIKCDKEGIHLAITKVHQALNSTAKFSVFNNNIDIFVSSNPKFKPLKNQLIRFFEISDDAFFNTNKISEDYHQTLIWLRTFCRQCRDCERGLTPNPMKAIS